MRVVLGYTTSEKMKVNKSFTAQHTYEVIFNDDDYFSITSPQVKIKLSNITTITNCNYMRIPDLNRYYYITDITSAGGIAIIRGEVDVLKSYQSDILSSSQLVVRSQKKSNERPLLADSLTPIQSNIKIYAYQFGEDVFKKDCARIILETTGKGGTAT